MSAAEALTQARTAGIRVKIDGEALVLEASAPPPAELLDLLARHKAAILRELREAANNPSNSIPATGPSQGTFAFAPPGDPANDDEALQQRAGIMAEANGWNDATAMQEARWQADKERSWRAFLRNAHRVLEAPPHERERLLRQYQDAAGQRYGAPTARDMAQSLRGWVRAREVQ